MFYKIGENNYKIQILILIILLIKKYFSLKIITKIYCNEHTFYIYF